MKLKLHRQLNTDDNKGMSQALLEKDMIVTGKHLVSIHSVELVEEKRKNLVLGIQHKPLHVVEWGAEYLSGKKKVKFRVE